MALSKRTRYEILRRDGHACRYCHATDQPLTVDHVNPVALGGSDDPSNLVAACRDCNSGKASTSPDAVLVEDVQQADLRWAAAIKRAVEIKSAELRAADEYVVAFLNGWDRGWLPDNYESSLHSLRNAGLPVEMLDDAVRIAQGARGIDNRFRYFCGVAWRKVNDLHDIAKSLIAAEDGA